MAKKKDLQPNVEIETKVEKNQEQVKPQSGKKRGKKYSESKNKINKELSKKSDKGVSVDEAVELIQKNHFAKFVETLELHINVNSQGMKGEVNLPHSTGKTVKIAVADDALIEKLEKNIIDFDILVSTPAMMPKLTRYAKILGPKGLMPNPKSGTVGTNTAEIVQKFSGNVLRYKTEGKASIIHLSVGKIDFEKNKLVENINAIVSTIDKKNITSLYISSTMSPSIMIRL
ncbi:MAG: hypothetical protein U0525_01535 [Patescibacteria group bacterium]